MVYITTATDAAIKSCEKQMQDAVFLMKETRENHSGDYPLHNRYFSNGDKPWVVLVSTKNPLKLIYDSVEYTIKENELVFFDDNVPHAWEMKNNDLTIYFYRAKTENPVNSGTYCIDELFKE